MAKRNRFSKQKMNRSNYAPRRYHSPVSLTYITYSNSDQVHEIATQIFGSSYYLSYEKIIENV